MTHAKYAKVLLSSLLAVAVVGLMFYTVIVGLAQGDDVAMPGVEVTQLAKGVVQYRTQHGNEVCYTVVGKLHGWTVSNSCFQRDTTVEDFAEWLK
jgi:hypothetical protein